MKRLLLALSLLFFVASTHAQEPDDILYVPKLTEAPAIDGDLGDWKDQAYTDGIWDIYRIQHAPWYEAGRRNRLTDHGNEPHPEDDLRARYYVAWDDTYLYFGAEVVDNVNDLDDPDHAPHRWMFKDSICWFLEAPRDKAPERFAQGDNAFCFIADPSYP